MVATHEHNGGLRCKERLRLLFGLPKVFRLSTVLAKITANMFIYAGLAAWGVAAFVIYKLINFFLVRRQVKGKWFENSRGHHYVQ